MIRFTRAQVLPIALDLGHDSVKMLQLERAGDGLSVLAAARQSLPAEAHKQGAAQSAAIIDLVRQMLRQGGFHGRSAAAALPREIVHVRNLRLPNVPAGELETVVRREAHKVLPFEVSSAQLRFLTAGEVRQGPELRKEVMLLAAQNERIGEFLELLHACGLAAESLDVQPVALYRTVERYIRRREDEAQVHVLVDIGAARTQVVIGRARQICFLKTIELGGGNFNQAVSRKLGITIEEAQALRRRLSEPAAVNVEGGANGRDPVRQAASDATRSAIEDLGREISLCLRYYTVTFRGYRPTCVRLMGGEACDTQVQTLLQQVLPLPVQVAAPLYSVDTRRMSASDRRGTMAEWATAFGLSLKMAQGKFGPRDGKPRDPNAPRNDLKAPGVASTNPQSAATPTANHMGDTSGNIQTPSPQPQEGLESCHV